MATLWRAAALLGACAAPASAWPTTRRHHTPPTSPHLDPQSLLLAQQRSQHSAPACAAAINDRNGTIATTGFIAAEAFGVSPDKPPGTPIDNAPPLREAISCFHQVFIPAGDFNVNSTLVFADEFGPGSGISIGQMVRLRGVSHEKPPRTMLHSDNTSGPVVQLGSWSAKYSSGAACKPSPHPGVYITLTQLPHRLPRAPCHLRAVHRRAGHCDIQRELLSGGGLSVQVGGGHGRARRGGDARHRLLLALVRGVGVQRGCAARRLVEVESGHAAVRYHAWRALAPRLRSVSATALPSAFSKV